jgi:hypothetical protein
LGGRDLDKHILLMIEVARNARQVRPGGTLLFMGGTGVGLEIMSTVTAASSFAKRFPSGASSDPPTQPHSRCTSRLTALTGATTTSTAGSSSSPASEKGWTVYEQP